MSHARIVKTEFLADEALAQVSPSARLFLLGAASLADPNGVLENRPLRVKVASMPHDPANPESILGELLSASILERSESGAYLKIVRFSNWFKPFPNEPRFDTDSEVFRGTPVEHAHASLMHQSCIIDATDKDKDKTKDKTKTKTKEKNRGIDLSVLDRIWSAYPPRKNESGDRIPKGNKQAALNQIERVRKTHQLSDTDLEDIAREYNKHPNIKNGFVQMVETFFGERQGRWLECWQMVQRERMENADASQ